ncbi:thiol peroxidase [Vibrio europaeus]|uniref:Thiol peroxidase n=1 Tax=Vibrio europaeus TaxID=300876 RepID=A0AAE7AYQ3_9VIBR|nr:thiol peroxidase [Vibrio europaeus]MDC5804319.1 thiol peroxidase [Vibrio europaeus]MDC5808433.1 thiol peroxidase [Vibrio europaeus]MDC5824353.1 thiol peroxidase [Vibrio europaeus]MDC5829787.1 thiol peroxidase [Vibrio europaeus]MDC5833683.1 thiol peroxidase [Vibrio europaeus]
MSQVTFQGAAVPVSGSFPAKGSQATALSLTAGDLSELTLDSLKGKKVILNIFPSIDTPVCAQSVRAFNEKAASKDNTVVLCVSADLPFAAARFCELEGIEGVQHASTFRSPEFAQDYGVAISEGALAGLTARAVVCVNEEGLVTHSELVAEITEEPNYDAALASL